MELKIESKVELEHKQSKYLLSLDEELELAARAQRGCDPSREKLIVSNIRLAYHIARSFAGLSLSYDELVSEGMFGLVVAVDKFNPSRRVRFACYASYWIRQKMLIAIKKRSGIVRIPLKLFEKVSLIKKKGGGPHGAPQAPPNSGNDRTCFRIQC